MNLQRHASSGSVLHRRRAHLTFFVIVIRRSLTPDVAGLHPSIQRRNCHLLQRWSCVVEQRLASGVVVGGSAEQTLGAFYVWYTHSAGQRQTT